MFRFKYIFLISFFAILASVLSQPASFSFESLDVGSVSSKNIIAPKSITYIDTDATNKAKEDALSQVQNAYDMDKNVSQTVMDTFSNFITAIIDTQTVIKNKTDAEKGNTSFSYDDFLKQEIATVPNPYSLSQDDIKTLLSSDENELKRMEYFVSSELDKIYTSGITEDSLETTKNQLKIQFANYYFPESLRKILSDNVVASLKPNLLLNVDETEQRKKDAEAKVESVYKVIKKGEMIVRLGDVITTDQIDKLQRLGLVQSRFDYFQLFKQMPYIFILFTLFHIYGFKFHRSIFISFKTYGFVLAMITGTLLLMNLIKSTPAVIVPFLTTLMTFVVFWGRKFTVFSSVILGLLLSINIGNDFIYLVLCLITGIVLSLKYNRWGTRIDLIKSGILIGLSLSLSSLAFSFSFDNSIDFSNVLPIIGSSFLASIITIGIFPIVENALGLVTSVSLHELVLPSHPLLKRLINEAPGTYHHSLMVGNLAEAAAERIGANSLLVRAGSYFHDVGKLTRPQYFIENVQPGFKNPHTDLSPLESARIILEHPLDSVKLCKEHKLPEPVIQLISSHHSDSILYHLYDKAIKAGMTVDKNDFKYHTPTPKTREEGLLLLADSTEAYSRLLIDKTKEEIQESIRQLIFDKVTLGDLRDCELSFKDLEIIIKVFVDYLINSTHKRISYKSE